MLTNQNGFRLVRAEMAPTAMAIWKRVTARAEDDVAGQVLLGGLLLLVGLGREISVLVLLVVGELLASLGETGFPSASRSSIFELRTAALMPLAW
jgi:hypothetical protein